MKKLSIAPNVAEAGHPEETEGDTGGKGHSKENAKAADAVAGSESGVIGGILKNVTGFWA